MSIYPPTLKVLADCPVYEHGDLVKLPSGEIVRWQDDEHPPTADDRGWYCHPQDEDGNGPFNNERATWDKADRSLPMIDEMWHACPPGGNRSHADACEEIAIRTWSGGLVAPKGKPAVPSWLTDLDVMNLLWDVRVARRRLGEMNFKELRLASTSVPFGDRASMLQDAIRCSAECLLGGEIKVAFRYFVRLQAQLEHVSPDVQSSDAIAHVRQVIERVLCGHDERDVVQLRDPTKLSPRYVIGNVHR